MLTSLTFQHYFGKQGKFQNKLYKSLENNGSKESINQDLAPGASITFKRRQTVFALLFFFSAQTVQTELKPGAK